jgi:hypothetical protein
MPGGATNSVLATIWTPRGTLSGMLGRVTAHPDRVG